MSLLIKDQEAVFTPLNVPTGLGNTPSVTARPNVSPFSVLVSGSYVQDLSRLRVASMDPNRNWYLNLPWPSESLPTSVQWTILRSDGTALSGAVPEGVAGPVTVAQLLATYGWSYTTLPAPGNVGALSLTLTAPQEFTVTGSPSGPSGTIGLAWKNEAGNTFFAAPSGSTGIPGFRHLVPDDIPNLDASKITTGSLPPSLFPAATYSTQGVVKQTLYNVKDYGALGDGSTNDTSAIQSAINAAHTTGGGIVYLPPGTYIVSGVVSGSGAYCLQLYGNVTLSGAGQGATVIKLSASTIVGSADHFVYIITNNAVHGGQPADYNIVIKDLTVNGNAVNFSTPGGGKWAGGLRLVNTRHAVLQNLTIKNVFGDGQGPNQPVGYWESFAIDFEQSVDTKLVNCTVTSDDGGSTASGFALNTSSNAEFVNCTASNSGSAQGFAFYKGVSVLLTNCSSYNNAGAGYSHDTCQDMRYTSCSAGGAIDPTTNDFYSGSTHLGNTGSGWLIGSSVVGGYCLSVELVGCTSRYNGASGLIIQQSDRTSVVGGDFSNNGVNGIGIESEATNVFISPNTKYYGNTSTDLARSGVPIVNNVQGSGAIFYQLTPPTPTATVGLSGSVGANILANTSYIYTLTVQSTNGYETTQSASSTATTGGTPFPITVTWGVATGDHVNVYRGGLLIHVANSGDTQWIDDGSVAPSGAAPTYNRTGRVQASTLLLSDGAISETTGGAMIAINATQSPSLLIDARFNGVQKFTVDTSGGAFFHGAVNNFNASPLTNATVALIDLGPGGFGATGGTNFSGSANGTYLGINAGSGSLANLIDAQVAGVSEFRVDHSGNITTTGGQILNSNSASSGTWNAFQILADASGQTVTAGNTVLTVNLTKGTGSGGNTLLKLQTGGVTKFFVDEFGGMSSAAGANSFTGNALSNATVSVLGIGPGGFGFAGGTNFSGSSSGTFLGINAGSGYLGNLIDAQVVGLSKFSVDASGNITTMGTLTLPSQSQNFIFAAPSGSNGVPGFRALAASDIPNIDASKITAGQLALARGGTAVDGSSITANFVFAGPTSGVASSAAFRALVAGDVPTVNPSALTGSGTVPLAALSGITTTQLSASAAITSGQIASVSASTLTGTNTLPDGVLSTNVPLLNAANTFTTVGSTTISLSGTLGASNSNTTLVVQKAPSLNGFTSSGVFFQIVDNASGGSNTGLHIQTAVAGTEKFRLDNSGGITQTASMVNKLRMAAPTGVSTAGAGTGGTLVSGTPYFWIVTALDPLGNESGRSSEVTFTASASNTKVTVSWSSPGGAMGYNIYRTTTSGTYTSVPRYTVTNTTSYTDDGTGGTTASGPSSTTQGSSGAWYQSNRTDTCTLIVQNKTASANIGSSLSLGSGPFDGATTGKFAGSSSGTILAMNATSGYTGNLIDLQTAGTSEFKVDASGNLTITGGLTMATQTANTVFAGPTSGGAAAPGFRALVAGDVGAVNPSVLTGSGTIPLAANTPTVAAGGLSTAYYLYT